MSGSVNRAIILGNVGKDPEIRSMQNGKSVASFIVATSESWKDKNTGERKENTHWHNVVVFSEGLVRVVERYLHKGSKVYLEGSIQTRKWTDKNGVEKYSTEIVLQGFNAQLVLLDDKPSGQSSHAEAKSNGYAPQDDLDDEIPF